LLIQLAAYLLMTTIPAHPMDFAGGSVANCLAASPARLSQSYLPKSRSDFSATFTTVAFDDSSLRWLEINT
jgi:hypothetical protein